MEFDDQRQCKRQPGMIVSMGKALGNPLTAVKNRLSKEAAKKPPPSPAEGSLPSPRVLSAFAWDGV